MKKVAALPLGRAVCLLPIRKPAWLGRELPLSFGRIRTLAANLAALTLGPSAPNSEPLGTVECKPKALILDLTLSANLLCLFLESLLEEGVWVGTPAVSKPMPREFLVA